MKKSIFCDYSIKELIKSYLKKNISPVEVARQTIEYIRKNDKYYNAWTVFDAEKLLIQAKKSEERIFKGEKIGFLEGIPVGVKDIMNTKDFPTQMGSQIWKNFTPGNDARVVFNIKHEGALIPGKTETAEFAVHTLGKATNPHDFSRTPGTSSSGSAVAVSTGMVPAALGSQTAGSIMRPASFCGVYGFKPSFGLIPRTGILKTTDSLDSVGFFAYYFEDLINIFNSVVVKGSNYPISNTAFKDRDRQNFPLNKNYWKVGIIKTHTWDLAEDYAKNALLDWAKKLSDLSNTFIIEVIEEKDSIKMAHKIHETIYNRDLAYYFKEEFEQGELVSPIMKDLIFKGLTVPPKDYKLALEQQEDLACYIDNLFNKYDALISLGTAGHAPERGCMEKDDSSLIWTMTHLPVIGVPIFESPQRLPFGIQIISRKYNDLKLFKFSQMLFNQNLIPEKSKSLAFDFNNIFKKELTKENIL